MHQLLGANLWLDGKPGANISTEKIKAGSLGHGHFEQNNIEHAIRDHSFQAVHPVATT
jgi:hypothetical protein